MLKNLNNIKFKITIVGLFLTFGFFDIIKFSVFDGGVDSGYYLSTARDWVKLGRVPNFGTYNSYTPLGVMLYAVPFLIVDSPDIILFLLLNLCIYLVSFILFLRISDLLFGKSIWTIVLSLSFLYNTHGIVSDIKLENLSLVFGLLIVNIFTDLIYSKDKENDKSWGVKEAIIIGFLCALSFLTKQYGGLSLIFSLLIVSFIFSYNKIRIISTMIMSFLFFLGIYLLIQLFHRLPLETISAQLKGEYNLECIGAVYGQRSFYNMLLGLKYYKYDGIIFLAIYIIIILFRDLFTKQIKKLQNQKIYNTLILLPVVIILSTIPFYFQVYPHYVFFGIPFIYFSSMILIKEIIFAAKYNIILGVIFVGVFISCITIYSFYKWSQNYDRLYMKKIESYELEQKVNSKLKKGTFVHLLDNKKLWFKCEFVSPLPKTIGYGYLSLACLEEALQIENPRSFWIFGGNFLNNHPINNYVINKKYVFVDSLNEYTAVHYVRTK
jgi:hypothetical protein